MQDENDSSWVLTIYIFCQTPGNDDVYNRLCRIIDCINPCWHNRLLVTIDYTCTKFCDRLHGIIDCVTVNVLYLVLHDVIAGSFHLWTCMYDSSYVYKILLLACSLSCHACIDLAPCFTLWSSLHVHITSCYNWRFWILMHAYLFNWEWILKDVTSYFKDKMKFWKLSGIIDYYS